MLHESVKFHQGPLIYWEVIDTIHLHENSGVAIHFRLLKLSTL